VVVLLADMPRVMHPYRPPDRRLRSARRHRRADEGRPARQSHPLAARTVFAEMMAVTGDVGARALLRAACARIDA
jgi:CTP:molybdopterin cytidylyltransferase MocA